MTRAEMISAIQTLQQEVWGLKEQVARLVGDMMVRQLSRQLAAKPEPRRSKERS